MTHLAGNVAIITGAGKGLGRAYALELARCGAAVVVNNRRHAGEGDAETSAAQVVAAIEASGGRAIANYASVEAPDAGQEMVAAALEAFGRLDIVIANAAVPQAKQFHKLTESEFRTIFDVSFFGTLHVLQAAWPVMREQNYGRIVTTTSSAGRFGNHGLSAYGAAKGAIESLTRTLAAEASRLDIKVNAISPYAVSQMTAGYLVADVADRLTPERVTPMVAWLASKECAANGEIIVAAGGRFRRGFDVETESVSADGKTMAQVYGDMSRRNSGRTFASSNAAFESLLEEMGLTRSGEAPAPPKRASGSTG